MLNLTDIIKNGDNSVKGLSECFRQGIPSAVFGVTDAFKHFLVAAVDSTVLLVCRDTVSAIDAYGAIKQFAPAKNVIYIPPRDEVLIMSRAFSKDAVYTRIESATNIEKADVIVAPVQTLMQIFPKKVVNVTVEKGGECSSDELVTTLVSFGYKRTEVAESKGTFNKRGDVLTVFPINAEYPVRIDFFGDEAESIKTVEPETGRRIDFLNEVTICQAEEFIFADDDLSAVIDELKRELKNADADNRARLNAVFADIEIAAETRDFDTLNYAAAFSRDCGRLTDILRKDAVVVFDEAKRVYETALLYEKEFKERFGSLSKAGEVFSFKQNVLFSAEELKNALGKFKECAMQTVASAIPFFNPLKIINPRVSAVASYRTAIKEVYSDIKNWTFTGYDVVLFAGTEGRAKNFAGDLAENGITARISDTVCENGVTVSPFAVKRGFIFHEGKLAVIGSGNLFAEKPSERRIKNRKSAFFTAPETGDYCVHETHGIGRVLGTKRISSTEGTKDYVAVEYAAGDVLYVPVEQMDILTRYLGAEKNPKLSKIGGKDFEKIKKSVRESIRKMSFDLKKLYNERSEIKGYKFVCDGDLKDAFDGGFPFEETPDQKSAEKDIINDMTEGKVMDRLICGDVGYGKTEVALRAAFLAITNGKQVAMLAPTTILTEQHFNTAVKRFANFGIRTACLNRFRSRAEQNAVLRGLKDGSIDFVVGTHRLLSGDVGFKDLGLLILDEEQRFGVEHKEKIKLLKKNVDTLTLSATPIPRTLHMALSGIRQISTITTPPRNRLPVQTYVVEETDALIKDAVSREINRGGQVFILYNRVESIFNFAERVKAVIPDVRITVAHGRMEEKTLENNIMAFYRGETDVLISTTIIENGIDLPKANTLIVIDADNMGLSTLYQLKGRVGRSDRLAYAYFTYKRDKILSDAAFERLNAIVEFAEMGSGIKIAMRDLEIRGAGNVLGAQQHGHMDKIGYELYSKLLREELSEKEEVVPELDLRVSAYIPDEYIERNSAKMDVYKQIAETDSDETEKELRAELEDVYGKIPKETDNLINIAAVKRMASKLGVSCLKVSKDGASATFASFKTFGDKKLQGALDEFSDSVKVKMAGEPQIEFVGQNGDNEGKLLLMKAFFAAATE